MLARYSVKKPYTVLVGVILALVLGFVALSKMTTDLFPDMSFQYALIITTDLGASPEEVETDVTAPIEAAIATTSNIKNVQSVSYNSYSIVTCEYEQNANMDSVVIEIQQKMDQLKAQWDERVGSPIIMKINPDMLPIMMAAVDVNGMSEADITQYVENELVPSIESVEGVASVNASGVLKEQVEVTLSQEKIDAINQKITTAIKAKFNDAQKELDDAKKEVEKGQQGLDDAATQISNGLDLINDNKETLNTTEADLKKQLEELKKNKELLETAQAGLSEFMESELYTGLGQLENGIDEVKDQIAQLQPQVDELESQKAAIESQISELDTQIAAINAQIAARKAEISEAEYGTDPQLLQLQDMLGQLETGRMAAQAGLSQLDEGLQAAQAGLSQLKEVEAQLTGQLNEANSQIASQFAQMSAMGISVKTYKDLPAAAEMIGTTLTQINAGIAAIEEGLEQVASGKLALTDALASLSSNAAIAALKTNSVAAQLVNGQSKLDEAQSQIDSSKDDALDKASLENILTIDTLKGILVAQNFDMPAGYVTEDDVQYLLKVGDDVASVDELKKLVLMDMGLDGVDIIRLEDVAEVVITDNSAESYAIINGNPGITLSMEKQTGYSTGDVTDRILDKFDAIESENDNVHFSVLMNQGVYIDIVVESVVQNMIIGGILAIIVLFIFLKDIKPTLVIACSIPLSVVVAVLFMYFTGITLNIISMSGLVLGIGMLVDNSIVVIENIYRLRGEGYSVRKAAVEGANQVAGAIFASTLTTISVYAPIIFTEGITKQLFVDLTFTVLFTLGASLFIALTFVPAVSSAALKKTKEIKHPWFDAIKEWYGRVLAVSLKIKPAIFILSIILLAGSAYLALSRGFDFMNMKMETNQISVNITAKEDQTLEFDELTGMSNEIIERISDIEGIDTIGASAGGGGTLSMMRGRSNSVSMYILLDEKAKVSVKDVAEEIERRTADMNCKVSTNTASMDYSSMFGSGLSIQIKGRDIEKLQNLATEVAQLVSETEGTKSVKDGLDKATPQWTITVDKEKAAKYKYTVAQVYQLVAAQMAPSTSATTITTDIKDYQVFIRTEDQTDVTLDDIKSLSFKHTNEDGEEEDIPLTEICTMEETSTLSTINRDSQQRYLTVSCTIDADHNVTLVSNEVQKKIDKLDIPKGYTVTMKGEDENIRESMGQMVLMLVLAVLFIYLIMVAQFQSLLSPFIIMFTIPLAFTGGFIATFISGEVVGIISMLGFIMLAGVIVNNGIVLIDYINQARKEGKSKYDAIIEAGKTRLRPILMTALTTILAMSTTALGLGKGSEMMKPMAITIIGGLVYGTILTLIVIPCIYDVFNREKNMVDDEIL